MMLKIKILTFSIIVLGMSQLQEAKAYDRKAAIEYARQYTSDSGTMTGVYNSNGIYNVFIDSNRPPGIEHWTDCANFISQVLQAGSIRFRSGITDNDNTLPGRLPELGTGEGTDPINNKKDVSQGLDSNDKSKYSRVFQSVNALGRSLLNQRHGGVNYKVEDLRIKEKMWTDVKLGDLLMKTDESKNRWAHAMFITGYSMDDSTPSYLYCAHSNFRKDHLYTSMSEPDIRAITRVIHLPDAPIVKNMQFWSGTISESNRVDFLWNNIWKNKITKKQVGNKPIYVEILFDSDMNVTATPEVELHIQNQTIDFQPSSGNGCNGYGWYTGALAGNTIPERSWRGFISNPPVNKNVVGGISIKAQASDGTYNDSNNELDAYVGTGTSQFVAIKLDTRKGRGQAK